MDLIYANEKREELGVIRRYTLDLAYGRDENDFTLTIMMDDVEKLHPGWFVYIPNTEYGGVIDAMEVSLNAKEITYKGRTWHGILAKRIIQPEGGYDYYTIVSDDSREAAQEVIEFAGVDDMFRVVMNDDPDDIVEINYQFERYTDIYNGLTNMLLSGRIPQKMKLTYDGSMVNIKIENVIDYSLNEEWDSSQIDFTIEKNTRPLNHLICLGQGDLNERYVIHLFADENGGVQPYTYTENPVRDSDYILNQSHQIMTGINEIAEVYDYPNAQITKNYVKLEHQPADWSANFGKYYYMETETDEETGEETVKYEQYKIDKGSQLQLLTSKPSNWDRSYAKYFTSDGQSVMPQKEDVYTLQGAKPRNWDGNYGEYYYHYTDGTSWEWRTVDGISYDAYKVQTMKPTDWETNFTSYYHKNKKSQYESNQMPQVYKYKGKTYSDTTVENNIASYKKKIEKIKAYNKKHPKNKKHVPKLSDYFWQKVKSNGQKVDGALPSWKAKHYYTKYTYYKAPKWTRNKFYTKTGQRDRAPNWEANKYYDDVSVPVPPAYKPDTSYELCEDHYATLVEDGLKKMQEAYNCDKIEVKLDDRYEYDVGDIVGARENVTGMSVWQPITKKIVKIENNKINVNYEVGGTN